MAEKKCAVCNELKSPRAFNIGKDDCKSCELFKCSLCATCKNWSGYSFNQTQKGEKRKCKSCTGQGTATIECSECLKMLSLTLFRKDSRSPPICNQCRQEGVLEEIHNMNALTGEYVGHGMYDTLTGADDGSGI